MATIDEIRIWSSGIWLLKSNQELHIANLCIDTRNIEQPGNAVFIALKTSLRDGHNYIQKAYENGIRNFIVSNDQFINLANANVILVNNTLDALQIIAANHRKLFDIPVIGITGSNGKTIVKEWLYQLLMNEYQVVRSPKSFNSQIGVPLSVWQIRHEHTLGIFEAGISLPGEMNKLEPIICPTIGIFTNIGEAHNEGFESMMQKVNEKLNLFIYSKTLIYCSDHQLSHEAIQHRFADNNGIRLFTWSRKKQADLIIISQDSTNGKTVIEVNYRNHIFNIAIPFTDHASVENAIHCCCILLELNFSTEFIKKQLLLLHPVSMRMELKNGINDCTLINDTYSSDLTSLGMALNYLDQQKQHDLHTVILSDMMQMGRHDETLYYEVAQMLKRHKVGRFIGIGQGINRHKGIFIGSLNIQYAFYLSTDDFLQHFHELTFNNEAILLKGARVFEFEKIALLMEQQVHQTVMNINLTAIRHNLNYFRSLLQPGVKTMAMVKAFAYGSGSYEIAGMLQFAGVDYLTVAYTDEGITLRKAGITMPIMVMNPDMSSFSRMIAWKLEPEIYNFRTLQTFIQLAIALNTSQYPVHIKLDTGMHRLGFSSHQLNELSEMLLTSPVVKVASIFSHLAASDDIAQNEFTLQQAELFNEMSRKLVLSIGYTPILHLCNSAAIASFPQLHYDMVRLGIGLYGVESSGSSANLRQISTLKTVIAQITDVRKGENIGYGHHTIASYNMRIATICIGYADGYPRTLGNGNAYVLIHGQKATITGNICMDMCMADITHIAEAHEGDEAIVMGELLSVSQLAAWAGTIPYEIMTGISQRVKRVYVNED